MQNFLNSNQNDNQYDIVVGGQWGDEGKAKMIDTLAKDYHVIARYQGGANAGHTVQYNEENYVFHLIPSGILYEDKVCVIGNGVVLDIQQLIKEITGLQSRGISFEGKLKISNQAFVVLPFHIDLDKARDEFQKIGTTCRGIGPAYVDKYARIGIRVIDLENKETLKKKIEENIFEKKYLLENLYKKKDIQWQVDKVIDNLLAQYQEIKSYICNTPYFLNEELNKGKNILLEGAQGTSLDIDFGSYPFVTSSSPSSGGASSGTGLGVSKVRNIFGIFKVYITRVGGGNLPSALNEKEMQEMRKIGNEFGATTGRKRSCGWFDLVQARYSVLINGITRLVMTKIDILDHYDEIKVCTHYEIDGNKIEQFPVNSDDFQKAKPVYKIFEGWKTSTFGLTNYNDLPEKAKEYLSFIEGELNTPISHVSTGPDREQIIRI